MYTTATFRNNLTIEGLNPLRVACVAAFKGEGERGNWAREEGDKGRRGGKVPVFNIRARSRTPASPSLLTPATRATPISETLHSNFRMSSE